jgi:hypothetical protein
MSQHDELPRDVPFSISCYECDIDSPESLDQALAEGWTDIQYTPDGLAENFLGFCPEHSAEWQADLKTIEG